MAITRKDVEYIANLSRLEISEAEIDGYTKELSDILEHINRLSKINTDNVEPTYFVMDEKCHARRCGGAFPGQQKGICRCAFHRKQRF
jgi:aspartyl-tRNA(Asn)/glutamyl-tRNA(Gln) amidotransferase subunit C